MLREAGFKRLQFPVTTSRSAVGILSAYINNFIQIWCGTPFHSMPCMSNSYWMYLEPHGLPFESSGRKYIWSCCQILTIPAADFIGQTATSGSAQLQHAAWSEFICTVCQMVVFGAPSRETAIVWNQPERSAKEYRQIVLKRIRKNLMSSWLPFLKLKGLLAPEIHKFTKVRQF